MQLAVGSRGRWLGFLVCALVMGIPAHFGGVAFASTLDIFSLPSFPGSSNNISGANVSVLDSPAWYVPPPGSGYEWISYAATGCNTFVVATGRCTPGPANPVGTSVSDTPTAIFYQTFTLTGTATGNLDVWADDTAGVYLDTGTVTTGTGDTLLYAATATAGANCANAPIGCTNGMDAVIPLDLSAGTYTLVFDAYQFLGGSPFGVMYDGVLNVDGPSTPEPASYMLMGLGLAGLGTLLRHRKRAS